MPKNLGPIKARNMTVYTKSLKSRRRGKNPIKAPATSTFHKALRKKKGSRNWIGGF